MINKKEMQSILDLSNSKKKMDIIAKALDELSDNINNDDITKEEIASQIDQISDFAADNRTIY